MSAYISGEFSIEANISTPETGLVEFMVEIETREKTGASNPGFMVVEVTEKEKGQNVMCSGFNVTYMSSDPAGTGTNTINNKAVVYVSVSNFGIYTAQYGNEASNYTLSIKILPLPGVSVLNSDHIVSVAVDGGTPETLEYNVAGEAPYDVRNSRLFCVVKNTLFFLFHHSFTVSNIIFDNS